VNLRALLVVAFVLAGAAPALSQEADDAPLHISADNMSGSHGPEGDEVLLSGNVRITRERTLLTADRGRYLRAQGMLFLEDNVMLEDSTTTVTCDRASYSEKPDVIELSGNVSLVDHDATLDAPAATYDRKQGRAELYGGVEGTDRKQRIACDRAIYYRDSRLLQARGSVRGMDQENDLELRATAVDFDRITHEVKATGTPALHLRDEDGREAVIHANQLRLNTETRVAEAIDSVLVERDTLRARADYGLFDDRASRGWLLGHPRAWNDETTVTGDTLEMWAEKRTLKRVVVRGNAVMDYRGARPGSLGETNRLVGERADIYFTNRDIDSLVAVGKARNDYRGVPEKGKTPERNTAQGDTITVFFVNRQIDRARVEGRATGEYLLATDVADTSSADKDLVRYDASRIGYIVSRNRIELDQSAHLTYRDLELAAKRVEYDVDRQTLVATGAPELVDRGDKVTGHIMTYDLETRIGNIYQAETAYEKGLYHGQRIRKVTDNQLDVLSGSYSTCSLPEPHYHFAAHWMKIYLKDKLVAKPVVFYVRKVPIFALPFWIFPIKPGRHSGFLLPQFELGFTNRAGQFLRNAGYYWAPNDYMDLTVSGDYYSFEPSWVMRAEGYYKLLYALDGDFRGSFAKNESDVNKSENWDFNAEHSHQLGPNTRLVARASFVSSRDYNSSNLYGRSLSQRLNRFLRSSVAFSHSASWASISAAIERSQDLDTDEALKDPDGNGPSRARPIGTSASLPNLSETRPTLSVSFPTRAIGTLPFVKGTQFEKALSTLYFDLDTRFVSQYERRAFVADTVSFVTGSGVSDSTVLDYRVTARRGFAANSSLSDARRLFGWLNLRPGLFVNTAIFDFDELGHKVVPTGTWSSALTASTTLYGTFRPHWGAVEGIRHVIFPSVSVSYSPEFPNLIYRDSLGTHDRFRSFGGIGVSGFKQLRMNFGLDQRVQMKLVRGEQVQKLDNLISWGLGGSYDFLYRESGQKHPLSTLSSNVLIQPPGIINANLGWVTDVYSPRPVQSLGYNLGLNLTSNQARRRKAPSLPVEDRSSAYEEESSNESWSVDLAYSYSGGYQLANRWSSSQTGNAVLHYQFTRGWGFDYSASYDVTEHEMGTQRFSLTRDLHCWQAIFTRTFASGGEAEYYFRLGVKDQREIYIERGTRTGSIGGIQ
jgi:lipopolysaccharide assembly outer membrane protein LptD (OstA)